MGSLFFHRDVKNKKGVEEQGCETVPHRLGEYPAPAYPESTNSRLCRHKYSAPRYKCRGEVHASVFVDVSVPLCLCVCLH